MVFKSLIYRLNRNFISFPDLCVFKSCGNDMKLHNTTQGTVVDIFVKPNSKRFQVKIEDDGLVVFCREIPTKGRVNRELTKELSRLFERKVEILSGFSSRQKKILISDIDVDEVSDILSKYVLE